MHAPPAASDTRSARSSSRSRLRRVVRLRRWWRGMGEVLAFVGTGSAAILEVIAGKWPSSERIRTERKDR